jgi:Cu+-exporting ATPase
MVKEYKVAEKVMCYHCGDECASGVFRREEHDFCCEGCMLVYELLNENDLCTYYKLNENPGISHAAPDAINRYDYLDQKEVAEKLIHFRQAQSAHVTFFIPRIHCSSCIWLLENMHRLNKGIASSTVNFLKKEVTVVFNLESVKLSEIVFLLARIGYEPQISLDQMEKKPRKPVNRSLILKIGVAGFSFANIMMLSFPEYFSGGNFFELLRLSDFLGYINLALALPVFFFSASGFFVSAFKSLRYRYLNIDAPIALAIAVTFIRSVYEIISGSGAGYLDSMTGIVFFMLIGRYFQERTYESLSFDRDYKSYFPVGVTKLSENGEEQNVPVTDLRKGDKIIIRHNELIPCDSMVVAGTTHVDYSFITGESLPVRIGEGELIYAGAKQNGGSATLCVMKPTSQSYLTQIWNRASGKIDTQEESTLVQSINRYFTIAVLLISFSALLFWLFKDPSLALNAFTAVLIVACPCGLLLTSTFVNGSIMRVFGRNKFYLKNSSVIGKMATIKTIVFDKTGTMTQGLKVNWKGATLIDRELDFIAALSSESAHPLSRRISKSFPNTSRLAVNNFRETAGSGISGSVEGHDILIGSEQYVCGSKTLSDQKLRSFVAIDGVLRGFFQFESSYRSGLGQLIAGLKRSYEVKVLSGDNDAEKNNLANIMGEDVEMHFGQRPDQKMELIESMQLQGSAVAMVGDGLNDAGALRNSTVGIAVSDDTNTFSPACDAILDGSSFTRLQEFLRFSRTARTIIACTFGLSLIYNFAGLYFAVQGDLKPVIAAILMPLSSISIVLLSTVSTAIIARIRRL